MTTYLPQHPALAAILAQAPKIGIGEKQWAIHSDGCLWWTTSPRDCGKNETGLACCPWCQAPLQQVPLLAFLQNVEETLKKDPTAYGPTGLFALVTAHHRSRYPTCRKFWPRYNIKITQHASRNTPHAPP